MKNMKEKHHLWLVLILATFVGQVSGCADSGVAPVKSCANDSPAEFVDRVAPVYPELAKRAGLEGVVWVTVLIDTTGIVIDARIRKKSGANAGFEQAALDAAQKSTFSPEMRCGEPIEAWSTFVIEFVL